MKKYFKFFGLLFSAAALTFLASCGEDEPIIDVTEGIAVGDGFYFAKTGEDPAAEAQLKAAMVDAPSFGAMSREGFYQTYAYLTAGDYNLIEVTSKEIVQTLGGSVIAVTGDDVKNVECDESGFSLVEATVDGAAFNVATDGLYVLAYDTELGEIIYDQITSAGLIGAATPGGWGGDTDMTTGDVNADGASWTASNVTLDEGEFKVRFNCRWAIDRRLDTGVDFDNTNGYSFFTNFGGSLDQLLPGNEGSNIQNDEYANFDVTVSWDPASGFTATKERVGDAEPKAEYPEELWMVGATIGGWDWAANGVQLTPVHSNPHLFWTIVWMDAGVADAGYKFAPQADWIGDFGISGDGTDGVYAKGTDNGPDPAESGYYIVVVNLETDNETIEVAAPTVYGIGSTMPNSEWTASHPDNLFTVDNANGLIVSPAFAADGELRIHVDASTFTPVGDGPAVEWWQAEFIVLEGMIEYRGTGDDQARANVTAGQKVSLNFKDGTGTIE
ncbi:MAG: SusF/SusE family outer membrane protein [Cyclobacteriaceae bacterium]